MTLRLIPNLLTHGDEALMRPHRTIPAMIGRADLSVREGPGLCDPSQAGDMALREWLAHVASGRIG